MKRRPNQALHTSAEGPFVRIRAILERIRSLCRFRAWDPALLATFEVFRPLQNRVLASERSGELRQKRPRPSSLLSFCRSRLLGDDPVWRRLDKQDESNREIFPRDWDIFARASR